MAMGLQASLFLGMFKKIVAKLNSPESYLNLFRWHFTFSGIT
jgi:hypothetical protein